MIHQAVSVQAPDRTSRILGIDPGLRRTGWGVIDVRGNRRSFVGCGTIRPKPELVLSERLAVVHRGLIDVLDEFRPDEAAVEETFVNKDGRSTLKLGQARGVALLAPALRGLQVGEYAPTLVKKSVCGTGHGTKDQIGMMVKVLLPQAAPDSEDAADALAIALTHASLRGTAMILKGGSAHARRTAA